MDQRRVVITGMGILSPVGCTVEEAWHNIRNGNSGIDTITQFDINEVENHIAGEVLNFDAEAVVGRKEVRRTDRATQFAIGVSRDALAHSALQITEENRYRVGVLMGTGIGSMVSFQETVLDLVNKGHRGVSPLAIPRILSDSSAGKVSMDLGLRGPNFTVISACATGNNAIGESAAIISRGQADAMIAGATEAAVTPLTIAGFNNMKALSKRNDNPQGASRPFDLDRDGFVIGEGAGAIILEELEHARARGATIYGEVVGYGHTSDAYHPTAPMETGEGAAQAMHFALEEAGLTVSDIDYVNAHGTGTPLNDRSETAALKRAFGEAAYNLSISSTKSMTGHLLGAAGAIEAIFCVMAIQENFIPPTINIDTPDPDCDLNYTPNEGKTHPVNVVMSNAFGFGGHNTALIIKRYTDEHDA